MMISPLRPCPLRLLAVHILLLAPMVVQAQTVMPRPIFGYEYGVPLALERAPGRVNRFSTSGSGVSSNHTLWLGVEILDNGIIAPDLGAGLRLSLALASGRFTSDPYLSGEMLDRRSGAIIATRNIFAIDATASMLQIELPIYWRASPAVAMNIGPWGSLRVTSGLIETERNIDGLDAVFPASGSASRTIAAGESIGSFPLRYGLRGGLSADLPITSRILLSPELSLRLDVGALARGLGVRSFGVGAGLGINFGDPGQNQTLAAPIEPAAAENATVTAGSLSLDLYNATDPAMAALIHRVRTRVRHYRSARPFLDENALARYRYLGVAQAAAFLPADLTDQQVALSALDLAAWRMRARPSTTITLTSPTPAVADKGARYLEEIWEISPERIRTARGGGNGLRITSTDPLLFAPVVREWIEESFMATQIGVRRSIDGSAGVVSSRLIIRQGERVIASERNGGALIEASIPVDSLTRDAGPLVGELIVDDGNGTVSAFDTLALEIVDDVREHQIHVFHFSTPIEPSTTEPMLTLAASMVDMGSNVEILYAPGDAVVANVLARRLLERVTVGDLGVRGATGGDGVRVFVRPSPDSLRESPSPR